MATYISVIEKKIFRLKEHKVVKNGDDF